MVYITTPAIPSCFLAFFSKPYSFILVYFIFIFIIFFHWHNSLQKQNLGIKVARLVKWISGYVCELLLTLFSNNNSSNRAVLLFVQTQFDLAKQSVLGLVLTSFADVG